MHWCSDVQNSLVVQLVAYVFSVLGTKVLDQLLLGCPHMFIHCLVSIVEHTVSEFDTDTFLQRAVCTGVVVFASAYVAAASSVATVSPSPAHCGKEINVCLLTLGLVFT